MKSVFEINELHLKVVYKFKGCSSEYVPNGIISNSYITCISIERKLQMRNESFRNAD